MGLVDDLRNLNPAAKMLGILMAATVMVFGGYSTAFFSSQIANIIITLIWIAGIANAFNLLDNMDGLAAGTALVVSAFLAFFFFGSGNTLLLAITLALAGSVLGFWIFNFPPASIYMGDSGSIFIGTLLATISIAREPQASNVFAIVAVPAMIFLLPILDTMLVSITRVIRGQSPVQGDRDHASHRLALLGLSERQTLFSLLAVSLISGLAAILIEEVSYSLSLFVIPLVVTAFTILLAYLGQVKISTVPKNRTSSVPFDISRVAGFNLGRRIIEGILDFFLILFAALWADTTTAPSYTGLVIRGLPAIMLISFIFFYVMGIYRFLWHYIGLPEILRMLLAAAFSSQVSLAAFRVLFPGQLIGSGYFLAFGFFLFALLAATRISFRLIGMVFRRVRHSESVPVLVFGAGDAGSLVLRECQGNDVLGFNVIGFIDDDPGKAGRIIQGVSVLGNTEALADLIKRHKVQGVIIATGGSLDPNKLDVIVSTAKLHKAWIRKFSLEFELL